MYCKNRDPTSSPMHFPNLAIQPVTYHYGLADAGEDNRTAQIACHKSNICKDALPRARVNDLKKNPIR